VAELANRIRANTDLERLRLIGAVVLAVGVILVDVRQTGDWDAFFRLVVAVVPCLALYALAFSVAEPDKPLERWQTAAALSGLALLFLSLIQLADMLGASGDVSSGNGFWVTAVVAAAAAAIALRFHSPVHTLVAAFVAVVSLLFFIDWASDDLSLATTRNVLVAITLLYWGGAYWVRRSQPDLDRLHGDYLVMVGGLAGIVAGTIGAKATGGLLPAFATGIEAEGAAGWELFLLSVSILLIYYTAWQGYRASTYLGLYGLVSFIGITAEDSGIWGWPLLLVIAGLAALGASLYRDRPGTAQTIAASPQPPDSPHTSVPPPPDTLHS
jgi:hypothetical protein